MIHRTFALLSTLMLALGCTATESRAPAEPTADTSAAQSDKRKACESMKDVFRVCYDNGAAGVSCGQMRSMAEENAAKVDAQPSVQRALGQICEEGCKSRKDNVSWSTLNEKVNCGHF